MEKYGFVYIWYDRHRKMYYIGSHWGTENDGYICSSDIMRKAYRRRPNDFKRRIIEIVTDRTKLLLTEHKWLSLMDEDKLIKNNSKDRYGNIRYYNLSNTTKNPWWDNIEKRLTIGEKISKAKKGKSTGPCSEEKKLKISASNKGKKRSKEMNEANRQRSIGRKRTEEQRIKQCKVIQKQWDDGKRKKSTKVVMTKDAQIQLSSSRLKQLWSDPEWKEAQRKRLSEGAKNRPPRSEESKLKTSESVRNTLKHRNLINNTELDKINRE